MQGEARNVRVWRTGNTEYTETKYYQVSREGDVKLENLTENALGKANQELICGVMPYDFKDVKKFQLGFLSGFLAEKRDIEKKQIEKKVQQEARESAEKLMREQIQFRVGKKCRFPGIKRKVVVYASAGMDNYIQGEKRKNLLFFHERTDWKGVRRTPDRL